MKIERTKVLNMDEAIRGMRNPMNSWHLSDSRHIVPTKEDPLKDFEIGEKDAELALKLIRAGTDHRKFLRQIFISCFITIPRYIWTELDTYKVATVRNSCSTMHKLGSRDLSEDDFQDGMVNAETLYDLNALGKLYRENKSANLLRQMKGILPESFLQAATYTMNYETAMNMYHARKNHRMREWSGEGGICEWIRSLPMMDQWLEASS